MNVDIHWSTSLLIPYCPISHSALLLAWEKQWKMAQDAELLSPPWEIPVKLLSWLGPAPVLVATAIRKVKNQIENI